MNPFEIRIEIDHRYRYYKVEEVYRDGSIERFKLIGKNNSVIIQSNRPLLRAKGLRHKKVDWKILEGIVLYPRGFELIITEIMKAIDA